MKRLEIGFFIIIVLCFFSRIQNADAFIDFTRPIGYNADSMARGGTSIANGEDPSNMNFNPAVISETKGNSLDLNLIFIFPDFDYTYNGTDSQRYTSTDKDRLLLAPGMSFSHKSDRFAYGFTIAAVDAVATDYSVWSKNFGSVNASSELLHLRLGPAFTYDITPDLSVGVRLGIDYASLDMRFPMGAAYVDMGQADGWGFSGAVGLFYKPFDNLSVGLYYESPTFLSDLETKHADGYIKMGDTDIRQQDVKVKDLQFPQNAGLGISYMPIPSLRLSCDVKYINWDSHWDEMELEFSAMSMKVPVNVDDQLTFGVGVEYFISEMYKVSLGYHFNDNPMDDNFLNPYVPTEIDHTVTLGFSVKPVEYLKIGFAYMYGFVGSSESDAIHGYDASLEEQFGYQSGALNSELSDATLDNDIQSVMLSVVINW
ncbi:hypothetical protein DSCO28_00200 [Desulfosarcina ovata subsp. sediminis]|uniref:Aromatic hydrocarbon degradation protein n=1 Tax=Desulfosarcina ovata subsp. sediminis TaxID=885957 RepID=A0A5K7ZDY1_9BACT|nr:outer membrane protein transport protein [Desulfosarcina ovata]BBO79454.1 hypothetical protein DSCO28_00200 [Desulfosarcina ovata subsp. sediminis]